MTIYGQDCFIGMKIKVDDRGNCSWQPNKFAGNHISSIDSHLKMTEALVK